MDDSLKVRIDLDSGVPAIRQITDNLRVLLVEGKLDPGVSLPSVRRLAIDLGVHFNTVAEAYRQLEAEGWIELRQGKGAVVRHRQQPVSSDRNWAEEFRMRLRALVAQMRSEGMPAKTIAVELDTMSKAVRKAFV